ncbi:MAG: hypothetical protein AAGE84_05520 [Cyanobacteria bacterium P01_G01_bin.39]
MSSLSTRLAVFRKLPLRAQLSMITATQANPTLNQKADYIASLKSIHAESLGAATESEKIAYYKAKDLLES